MVLGRLTPMSPMEANRIVRAVMSTVKEWEGRVLEIEAAAEPSSATKAQALALARDMETLRRSLERVTGLTAD